jgi:DNA (cytosine-5)-methyltransferase 1
MVPVTHSGDARVYSVDEPLRTQTTVKRGEFALITPMLVGVGGRAGQSRPRGGNEPTATGTSKADTALVTAHLQAYYGEGSGGKDRSAPADEPMRVITTENRHALVTAFLAQHNGGPKNEKAVMARPVTKPISTTTTRATQQQLVTAHLMSMKGSARRDRAADQPADAICAEGNHAALVCAFLQKYFGTGGQDFPADGPMHTIRTRGAMSVVTVTIDGECYEIVDIGMRMLTPRELFRAQGFNDNYKIDVELTGELIEMDFQARKRVGKGRRRSNWLTKEEQTRCCGNSVNPDVADDLVMNAFAPGWAERRAA